MTLRISAMMAAAAFAVVGFGSPAMANCQLTIEPGQDEWLIRHDPFTQDIAQRQFDVALFNRGDAPCEGVIRTDLRGEQFGLTQPRGGERVAYALIDERGGADITPRAGRNARRIDTRSISVAPGERSLVRFTFAPDTADRLSAGNYTQNLFLAVEDASGGALAQQPVTLSLNVISTALMGLKGQFQRSNGVANIDLGELQPGLRPLRTSLYVLSTAGYSVSVSSANAGQLRLGQSDWYVDYSLGLDNRWMDLKTVSTLTQPSQSARADDYDLSVEIGSVAGKRAGNYSDTVTFTISAL